MLISYDQIAGELQYRTLRFTVLRARRESLVLGKALAMWATASILALALNVVSWFVLMARGESLALCAKYGLRFWLAATLFAGAYSAFAVFVSGFFKTPVIALFVTLVGALCWWLLKALTWSETVKNAVPWIAKLTPGEWEPQLLSPDLTTFLSGAGMMLLFQVVFIAGAAILLRRRDV
jgi:hypothetical protein